MCDEGETADQADAVRTESQKMESRAGETALDGSARSIIVLIVVGMLVGVLSGTFGIGGGTVIVPALVWLGLSQRNAAATSMLAIVPTSISGVISYATGGHVDWLAAALLFCGMFIGGQIGSWLLGIGGGALAVPSLSMLFGASDLVARGTSLLAMFPNSITTSAANLKRRLAHVKAALIIGLVAAVTAPLGTWIAGEVSPRVGAIMFACYLCVLLVRSVFVAVKATRAARVARG